MSPSRNIPSVSAASGTARSLPCSSRRSPKPPPACSFPTPWSWWKSPKILKEHQFNSNGSGSWQRHYQYNRNKAPRLAATDWDKTIAVVTAPVICAIFISGAHFAGLLPRFAGLARFLNPNEYGLYISLSPFLKFPIDILGYINYNVFMGYIK
nr:MAG TPA: hypothetical protein [Caudoviricetes sp.]